MATAVPSLSPGAWRYPVQVDAQAPPRLSRWLWLVKWLLVIPHLVVLAFLWVGFVALSAVAFVAILVTGRYPRGIFDVNVGILRWSWRVALYSYGALATDQYPPFTLAEVPDYPAHLHVDYPEHLSRGLVLVKWWLLALPHYLVVAILVGTGVQTARVSSDVGWRWEGGLIGLLAIIAAVVLAVRGSYPRPLFDLLLGLHRWVLRVTAYAALMTDVYPPFRLDPGEHETAAAVVTTPSTTSEPAMRPATSEPISRPTGSGPGTGTGSGTTARMVGGFALLVLGAGAFVGGGTAGVGELALRDGGYLTSPPRDVATSGYAVELGDVEIHAPDLGVRWLGDVLGDVRVRATAPDGTEVFLGVAPAADAAAYLDGVAYTRLVGETGRAVEHAGQAPAAPPEAVDLWVARSVGTGTQEVTVSPRNGTWVAVVMPADAGAGLTAQVDVGARVPWLPAAAAVGLLLGLGLIGAGAWLVGRPDVHPA
ncbi:DUF4389 domain-containing protein [uncultured Cellulomonas sp.]|uniref:DUF4389 domain-containing protein n=1 Tax=uncultured Cellulomonas sp. TaxID=189682 RepID=UPI0026355E14|nr:DUF4389 domain-containing protein [uncultured Cellulomonas sp.]